MRSTTISCADALAQRSAFDAVIDVRSPAEFAEDRLPGAINCPVLDDDERRIVGTQYRQESAFAARRSGAALVARNIARHLETNFAGAPPRWRPLVYCWRGGQRSAAMVHVLCAVGWRASQLDGGYRAFRRQVLADLEVLPQRLDFRVVCGPTGSGKSRLLRHLAQQGAQVLDLEALARHRGSVLGALPKSPQPSQKHYETELWQALQSCDTQRPVYVEAESRKVGQLRLPDALLERMRGATCIELRLPDAARLRLLRDEYAHYEADIASLLQQLDCLTPLHGREHVAEWKRLAAEGNWDDLVARLLGEHYDPAYRRSIDRNYLRAGDARVVSIDSDNGEDFDLAAAALLAG